MFLTHFTRTGSSRPDSIPGSSGCGLICKGSKRTAERPKALMQISGEVHSTGKHKLARERRRGGTTVAPASAEKACNPHEFTRQENGTAYSTPMCKIHLAPQARRTVQSAVIPASAKMAQKPARDGTLREPNDQTRHECAKYVLHHRPAGQ